jgi:hypothetical protein
MADTSDDDYSSLAMLRDYECPECGPVVDDDAVKWGLMTEDIASDILGGDDNGVMRCPDCGEELEQTLDARLDFLKMVGERIPDLAPKIADALAEAAEEIR